LVVVPCNDPRTNLEWVYTQPGDNPSGIQLTSYDGALCVLSPLPQFQVGWHQPWCSCLDAGTSPHNNGQVVVKTCAPGAASQHWYFTADNRIAITGGDQCLDYPSVGPVQTYKCTTGNTNQVWKPRFSQ
jgi:hypothetical protein